MSTTNNYERDSNLKTMGAGTQNLIKIFLMLSFRFLASRHHEVCSLAAPPAVGSGAPLTDLISTGEVKDE